MSILRIRTISDLSPELQARNGSQRIDAVAALGAQSLHSEADGRPAQAAGSGVDADVVEQEGWIVMPYPVGANRVWRNYGGRVVANPKAEAWKRVAAESARLAGVVMAAGAVHVHYRLHPKQNKDGGASKIRLDVDAPAKALLDALNGVAYLDDKQVIRLVGEVSHPVPGGALSVRVMA